MVKAEVCEVFSSVQGEGKFAGYPQVFVRFAGCNLRCKFCDTPVALDKKGARTLGPDQLIHEIESFSESTHHSLSLTGGEPLLQASFIADFLMRYGRYKKPLPVMLETNGTLPYELKTVLPYIDFISMDIKLPSSTGEKDFTEEHKLFLQYARKKRPFVKVVVTSETTDDEFGAAVSIVAESNKKTHFFIQPVTPHGRIKPPAKDKLFRFMQTAMSHLEEVRLLPQTHKQVGIK